MKSLSNIPTFDTETFKRRFATQAAPWPGNDEPFTIVAIQDAIPFLKFPLPVHRTASYDILFVAAGAGSAKHCGLKKYQITPPQLFFKSGGQITSGDIYGTDSVGYFCLIQPDFLTNALGLPSLTTFPFFRFGNNPLIDLAPDDVARFSFLFASLHHHYQSAVSDRTQVIASYLHVILQEALRLHHRQHQSTQTVALSSAEVLTAQFYELVGQLYLTKQRVDEYADLLAITPNHLNKVVKQTSGKTASALIAEMILMEANVLLKQTTMSVADIAAYLQFDDTSYFIRFFRKHSGMTPLDYRKTA